MPIPSHVRRTELSRRAREVLLALASPRAVLGLRVNELAGIADMPRSAAGSALSELEAVRAVRQRGGATAITRIGRDLVEAMETAELPPTVLRRPGAPEPEATGSACGARTALRDVARLQALQDTGLVGAGPLPDAEELDRLAALARRWTGVPCALVTLVGDRDLRVSGVSAAPELGAVERLLPVGATPCHEVVLRAREVVAPDAARDPRCAGAALVGAGVVAAYLGVPLRMADGSVVGTLCLLDPQPRPWDEHDLGVARTVAAVVQGRLRLRALARQAA